MDMIAVGCAFNARLISERLNPLSLFSSNFMSCVSMNVLSKAQQFAALINDEGGDPCNCSLINGRCDRPGCSKFIFDRA